MARWNEKGEKVHRKGKMAGISVMERVEDMNLAGLGWWFGSRGQVWHCISLVWRHKDQNL